MTTILGWTAEQWGVASAYALATRYDRPLRPNENSVEPTLQGACLVRSHWQKRRVEQPLEIRILGVAPDSDKQWAYALFAQNPEATT